MFGLSKEFKAACFLGCFGKTSELSPNSIEKDVRTYVKKLEPGESFSISLDEASDYSNLLCVLDGQVECSAKSEKRFLKAHENLLINSFNNEVQVRASNFVTLLLIVDSLKHKLTDLNLDSLKEIIDEFSLRDSQTFSHCKRVQEYSLLVARKLELSGERIVALVFSSLLHDIGKSSIPDIVLNKDSTLTEDEFEILKSHPITGAKMLEGILPYRVGEIIEQHHERLDGSGYPFGLADQDISIEAKIVCVADSYDAMTTNRPYHNAISPETALRELKGLAGKYYDRDIVRMFEECLSELKMFFELEMD